MIVYVASMGALGAVLVVCLYVARRSLKRLAAEEAVGCWERRAVVYRDGRWWYAVPFDGDGSTPVAVAWRGFRWLLVWRVAGGVMRCRLVCDERNRGIFFVEILP